MRSLRMLLTAVLVAGACEVSPPDVRAGLSLAEALGSGDTTGYRRAVEPRVFRFPADHGPHPGFRVEWWYVTGNLETADAGRFGFQLTFFRSAETADPVERASAWATADVWMAHFALTDAAGARFFAFERFARGAAGLAGASAQPFRVHVDDWSIAGDDSAATFPVRVHASEGDEVALDLRLERGRPIVLQGTAGLSPKGPEPGNASYYYSLTRMPAEGTVTIDGARHDVTGAAWLDREWSTSALGRDLIGWDWFALQLDDGRDLMLYQLRRADGTADPFSAGTLVLPDGEPVHLAASDFTLEAMDVWRSPVDGTAYPVRWRARVPGHGLDLEVLPVLAAQELNLTVRYWEGAVNVRGSHAGHGYLEMTGYAEMGSDRPRVR